MRDEEFKEYLIIVLTLGVLIDQVPYRGVRKTEQTRSMRDKSFAVAR